MLLFLFLQINDLKYISGFTDNMVSTFLKVTLDDGPGSTLSQCSSNMYIYYNLNYKYHNYFQHFYWLSGHMWSVHVPAVPNMVKECVSNNASWTFLQLWE